MSSALSPASLQKSLDQQTLEAAMKSIAQVPTCIAHEKATIDVCMQGTPLMTSNVDVPCQAA